jgi:hypothetical protein
MVICGGAMGGYWETGRVLIARRPASMTMMAITQAKMGLFMKKRDMKELLGVYLKSKKSFATEAQRKVLNKFPD